MTSEGAKSPAAPPDPMVSAEAIDLGAEQAHQQQHE